MLFRCKIAFFHLVLFILTIASLLLLGEILVRIYSCKAFNTTIFLTEFFGDDNLLHRASKNRKIGYELKPNYSHNQTKTNEFGFRDRSYPREKPENSFRIIVFGDSVTFGKGVEQKDTFPKQLERFLNDQDLTPSSFHFEVLNAGVTGYSAYQETEFFFEYGLPLDPDMIIFNYVMNDQRTEDGGLLWYFNRRNRFLLKFFFITSDN